jgi:hypothetical protein
VKKACVFIFLGLEFDNKTLRALLKEYNVLNHFFAVQSVKAALAERMIRTLKTKIYKFLSYQGGAKRYVHVLDDLVDSINKTVHKKLQMSPNEVTFENQDVVFNRLYPNFYSTQFGSYFGLGKRKKLKFSHRVGDVVRRVILYEKTFHKGYRANYSKEMYFITDALHSSPPMYLLCERNKDGSKGDSINGKFYGKELVKVDP